MRDNHRRLIAISKIIDIYKFYSISFSESSANLQGNFNPELIKDLLKNKFISIGIDCNGYVNLKRGHVHITLT